MAVLNKTHKDKKTKVVAFRLPAAEYAEFENKLRASDMSQSEFFREVFLNSNVNITLKAAKPKEYHYLIYIINKVSNNINQLAKNANVSHKNGRVSDKKYAMYLNVLINIESLLKKALDDAD